PPPPPPAPPPLFLPSPNRRFPHHAAGLAMCLTLQNPEVGGLGYGTTVELKFCVSCSYRYQFFSSSNYCSTSAGN
ncbi:hypothetical protein BHE74_00039618, partial [Ensete ventricosum]